MKTHASLIIRLAFAILVVLSAWPSSTYAAGRIWGNTGTDFNTDANWTAGSGGVKPGTADYADFSTAASQQPDLSSSLSITQVAFSAAGATGYTLSSSSGSVKLTLTSTLTTGVGGGAAIWAANTSGTNTISAPIVLGTATNASQYIVKTGGGTGIVDVSGPVTATNSGIKLNLSINVAGEIKVSGLIDSSVTGGIGKIGNGLASLTNTGNTFTGDVAVSNGTLFVSGNGALGNTANTLTLSAAGTLRFGSVFDVSTRTVTLNASTTAGFDTNGNDITFANSIGNGGAGGFAKSGSGKLTLNVANNYSGTTSALGGTLEVKTAANGMGTGTAVQVGDAATLSLLSNSTTAFTGSGTNYNITLTSVTGGTPTTASQTINVDRISGSGANTITIGNISAANTSGIVTLAVTSGNGYTLAAGKATLAGATGNGALVLNPTTGSLTLTGIESLSTTATTQTVTLDGTSTGNIVSGTISNTAGGTLNLTKSNSSTWELQGASSNIGGTTTVSGGILIASGANSSAGAVAISGGNLQLNNASNGGISTGLLTMTQSGSSLQALTTSRSISNALSFSAGSFVGTQDLTLSGLTTVQAGTGAITLTNNIDSSKTLTFSNANFYLNKDNTSVNGSLSVAGSGNTTISGAISNNAAGNTVATRLLYTGSGILKLSGANNYTGQTTVSGNGLLVLNNANALPGGIGATGGTSHLTVSNGIIGLANGDFTRPINATGDATAIDISGASGFAAFGADRVVNFGGAGATVTYGGNFFPTTLILGHATADKTVDFQNAINLSDAIRTVQVNKGSGVAAVDAKLSGGIGSTTAALGGITKTGNGTLEITNANTYQGATSVTAGKLIVSGSLAGAASVSSGATLGGSGTISGAVNSTGGTIAPGTSASTATLTLQTGVVLGTGTFAVKLDGSNSDKLAITGNIDLSGVDALTVSVLNAPVNSSYTIATYTGTRTGVFDTVTPGYTVDYSTLGQINLVVVPEPGTWAMLLFGFGLLIGFQRVRRNRVGIR